MITINSNFEETLQGIIDSGNQVILTCIIASQSNIHSYLYLKMCETGRLSSDKWNTNSRLYHLTGEDVTQSFTIDTIKNITVFSYDPDYLKSIYINLKEIEGQI